MTHPDLDAVAAALVDGSLGPLPPDEKSLGEVLYVWYLNRSPLPEPAGPLRPAEVDLPAALRAAHADSHRFEGAWRAENVSTWGRVVARRGALKRVLDRSDYLVPSRPGLRAEPGDALLVSRYWGWADEESGFWHARRGVWPPAGADRLMRLYWNVAAADAPRLVHALSLLLSDEAAPSYMIKTPAQPEHSGRADAMVLYLGPRGYRALESELRSVAARPEVGLRAPTPRFTRTLAPGLGFAEGSIDGDSFGESRCRLVAQAFLGCTAAARESAARVGERIVAAFQQAGLDPGRPYLNGGGETNGS